jgi:hypothetical protein
MHTKALVGKPGGKRPLGRIGLERNVIQKWIL